MLLKIRPMVHNDLSGVLYIESLCLKNCWSIESYAILIENSYSVCKVAELESTIVGYITGLYSLDTGDIYNMAVRPEFQQKGIGKVLLNNEIDEFYAKKVAKLFIEVRKSNTVAFNLYKEVGFSTISLRKNYYTNPIEDALIMIFVMNSHKKMSV